MEQLSRRYHLGELIGQGGMAKVYKAQDSVLGRTVAVKVLREQYADDKGFLDRFVHEAKAAASLSHPNIVNVFDVGDDGGQYYIVMEYVDGTSLKDLIQKRASLSAERVVSIASQICAGLQAAHGRNLVHRDIKPQNILVTPEGRVKIADFGIARALGEASFSETGQVLGSIHYLSPEQAQGKQATPASDIYALGVVCYEMLTGRLPFEGETVVGVALQHIQEPPRPPRQIDPSIPPTLESIVLRALAKEPAERYVSAKEMEQALRQYAQLGEQATGVMSPVKVAPSSHTTRIPPTVVAPQTQVQRKKGGGSFLLFFLAILALLSVLGLYAIGTAVYQAYTGNIAPVLPSFRLSLSTPTPEPFVLVPALEGMEANLARAAVEARGLRYAEGPPEESKTITAGRVIRQSIQPGMSVTPGLEVVVVLSKGQAGVDVPSVVGWKFPDAKKTLEEKGFEVIKEDGNARTQAKDTVLDQNPKGGTKATSGSKVTLYVNKGNNKISVPAVVGKPEAEAIRIITEEGLRLFRWINYQGHADLPRSLVEAVPIGHVLSTDPIAGTEVEPNTEVKIAVRKD